ncbi:ESPR-type extended signal peptide-containing protein [Stenotrophomonas maltophilia]|uniref:ESPR-type extended signal peptide-containing protein n=1 Tax=Stenotrophomonas maltophilia TaxID=40324 RepID=UPI000D0E0523|nr:ESPR-type extended signal peptide-containing protein [Stenotrophomonas maltophilia]PSM13409.1 hemagluttinin domain-containing protein [Stenotrophomonas maltophilia]
MNKIYRRLWSHARQCWVVASELTAARGKRAQTVGRTATAIAILALAAPASALASEMTEEERAWWAQQSFVGMLATVGGGNIGTMAAAQMEAAWTTAANYSAPTIYGRDGLVLGSGAYVEGDSSLGLGVRANATGGYSTAVGVYARSHGLGAVALGHDSEAFGKNTIAMGSGSRADGTGAMALGANTSAKHLNSIALGTDSQTSASNQVSVGNSRLQRKIVNVARGEVAWGSTEAVTGEQLYETNELAGNARMIALTAESKAIQAQRDAAAGAAAAYLSASGSTATTSNRAQASGTGATALGINAKAMTAGSIAVGDGASTTTYSDQIAIGKSAAASGGSNAMALGASAQAKHSSSVALGSHSVTTGTNQVSVGNDTTKRRIINVGDGTLSATSTDAVTGRQLYATHQKADSAANLAASGTAANATNKAVATAAGATALGVNAKAQYNNSVALGSGSVANARDQVSIGSDTIKRKIVNMADGALSATSTDAVTGKQLYATNQKVETAGYLAASGTSMTSTNRAQATGAGATAFGVNAKARTEGSIAIGDSASTSSVAESVNQIAIGKGASTSESGSLALGANAKATNSSSVALGHNSATNAGNQVSVGNATLKRKIVNVADGAVNASSTDAVTGKQLHATNTTVTKAQEAATAASALATTAKTSADAAMTKATAMGNLFATSGAAENATASGTKAVAIGSVTAASGLGALVVGSNSNATGTGATAVGRFAKAIANGAVAIGYEAAIGSAASTNSIAIGTKAKTGVQADQMAIGHGAVASGATGAMALGANSTASHEGAVALGRGSMTSAADQISVGSSTLKRRIVNVADGAVNASSTDAVTGRQLHATDQRVAQSMSTLDEHARKLLVQSQGISENRDEVVALRNAFGSIESELETTVKFSADKSSVDLNGATVRGVAAGDISSATSTEAVNGGQLFATNTRIDGIEEQSRFFVVGNGRFNTEAQAGLLGAAVGVGAVASSTHEGATALGAFATASGKNSVALGRASYVEEGAEDGFALGGRSQVAALGGVVLGAEGRVLAGADMSIAVGTASIASEAGTASFGNDSLKRRLVNVGRGTADHNATTVSQLKDALATLGGGAGMDASGNVIAPSYTVQGATRSTVEDALMALDGAVTTADSRVDQVEGQLRSVFQDAPSALAGGVNQIALAGVNGMVLTNLADGRIAAGSRDAVTGNQLHAVEEKISKNRGDIDALKERHDVQSQPMVNAGSGVIDYGGARLTGVAEGVISAGSTDVVNGGQLFTSNARIHEAEMKLRYFDMGGAGYERSASAGLMGLAIGDGAEASLTSEGGTAVGAYATASGKNSVALGRASHVHEGAEDGFALGGRSQVAARGGVALGAGAWILAGADMSVAVGTQSIAADAGTASFGNDSLKRRLVNVGRGTADHNAATVGQLRGALSALGGEVDAQGNIVGPRFSIQGGSQTTVNDALTALDGAVINTRSRVDGVEGQLRSVFQNTPSTRSDGANQLMLAGAQGMVLGNVANGAIAAGSRDAVNGGQLHAMQQQLNGRVDGLEQRLDGQPQMQARVANAPAPQAEEPVGAAPPVASVSDAPAPKANQDETPAPKPQVDTAELEKMLARANEYTDGAISNFERRLDKMDKRFNRMAAMSSAQSAMAMNTAGLATYNRLGAGVGYSDGESAMAVGYQRVLNDKGSATFSLNGAFTNSGERTVGVGVGIGW